MRISASNRAPVDVDPGRGGSGVQLGDGVEPGEVVEHFALPRRGPAGARRRRRVRSARSASSNA